MVILGHPRHYRHLQRMDFATFPGDLGDLGDLNEPRTLRLADLMQQKEANALKDRKVAEPEWSGTPKFLGGFGGEVFPNPGNRE